MYIFQCPTTNVQCVTSSVQCIFSSVQRVISSVQCLMSRVKCIIPEASYLLKSHWSHFRRCCLQYSTFYGHSVRPDVAMCLPGATLCCVSWLYYRLGLMQFIVWIDWLCRWYWWRRNVRYYHNKYTAKIKGAARLRNVTPRPLVNPTFRRNLVTLSSRDKAAQWGKQCCCTAWQTNTKRRLFETSVASQITSTNRRTAERSFHFVNMFDFRALCLGFVVHKVRVGQDLWCTRQEWDRICGAQGKSGTGFVVHKVRVGQDLWCTR
jgi:hypothetical protein